MKNRTLLASVALLLIMAVPGCTAYRQPPADWAAVPRAAVKLDVKRKVTGEGLTVLHVKRQNLPMVVFNLYVRAGAAYEPAELSGLAKLTAALLVEGTKGRTAEQVSREIEYVGAVLGTSAAMDYSSISLTVLKKDLRVGFDVFSDVLLNPVFPEEEIQRKKKRLLGALRQRQESPSFLATKAFKEAVYGPHPYGRVALCEPETLQRIERSDIAGFSRDSYAPNNSILAVVGDITEEELDALLRQYLGGWTRRDVRAPEIPAPPPPSPGLVRIDRGLTQANILLGHLGVSRDNPDYYPLVVMNFILGGGGFSSRLMGSIRDDMGLAYDVNSRFIPRRLAGSFRAGAQTKNSSANEVIAEMLRQIRRMRDEKVSPEELRDAKAFLVGSYPRRLETMSATARFLAQVEFFGLGLRYIEDYPGLIGSVTAEDVQRVARKYLEPENLVLVVVADQEEAGIKDAWPPDEAAR